MQSMYNVGEVEHNKVYYKLKPFWGFVLDIKIFFIKVFKIVGHKTIIISISTALLWCFIITISLCMFYTVHALEILNNEAMILNTCDAIIMEKN